MLKDLILKLGYTIRFYDGGVHSEHWTQDGDYIAGYDLDTMSDTELSSLFSSMSSTLCEVLREE